MFYNSPRCDDTLEARTTKVGNLLLNIDISLTNQLEKSLSFALAEALLCIKQAIQNISTVLENNYTGPVTKDMEINLENCMKMLQFLVDFHKKNIIHKPLDAESFHSYPKILACILLEVFSHCKNSESIYGPHFEAMGPKLTDLFKNCQQVQSLYLLMMTEHLRFDLANDQYLQILIEALDFMISIGEIVICLDVKTMAEQWKGISRVYEMNADWLRDRYVAKRAVDILSNEISNNINLLVADNLEKKSATRYLKVSNFILRILIKFAECFKLSLSTNFDSILRMLSWLNLYSKPYLLYLDKQKSLVQDITSNISIGLEPFLLNLIDDVYFYKSYLSLGKRASIDEKLRLGYLLLTIQIIKILLKTSGPGKEQWLSTNATENILILLFEIISSCDVEFSIDIKFEVSNKKGDPPLICSLYEYVLIHASALSVTLRSNQFGILEKCLCGSILMNDYWRASFAADLWCALARYGAANLCMDQTSFLMELDKQMSKSVVSKDIPQQIQLGCVLSRLFNLLPDNYKINLTEKYPIEQNMNAWISIRYENIPLAYRVENMNQLVSKLLTLLRKFTQEDTIISGEEFYELLQLMNLSSTGLMLQHPGQRNAIIENILTMWRVATPTEANTNFYSTNEHPSKSCFWMIKYIESLCLFTSSFLDHFTNNALAEIVNILCVLVQRCNSKPKLSALWFLETMADYNIKDDQDTMSLCSSIVQLFELLLANECSLINILGLEVFAYFSHNTNQEAIVANMGSRDQKLKAKIVSFLQGNIPDAYQSSESFIDYVRKISKFKFKHKCDEELKDLLQKDHIEDEKDLFDIGTLEDIFSDDTEEAPRKKVKLDKNTSENIEDIIKRLQIDTKQLSDLSKNVSLNCEIKKKLTFIINDLVNIKNNAFDQ